MRASNMYAYLSHAWFTIDFFVCLKDAMHAIEYMGFSLREDRWRFTEWIKWEPRSLRPLWNSSAPFNAIELYDHAGDFGASMDAATDKVNLGACGYNRPCAHQICR